jgi:hypothetical protein
MFLGNQGLALLLGFGVTLTTAGGATIEAVAPVAVSQNGVGSLEI